MCGFLIDSVYINLMVKILSLLLSHLVACLIF
jgi:hypothetical protein